MKLLVFITTLAMGLSAHAEAEKVLRGSIQFPGYGRVASNHVCLTDEGKTLTATIPAHEAMVCVKSHVDRSDSNHPKVVCDRSEAMHLPARTLETPLASLQTRCVKSHVDRSDSTHSVVICDETSEVLVSQDLTYDLAHFAPEDYRHEHPIWERHTIMDCE